MTKKKAPAQKPADFAEVNALAANARREVRPLASLIDNRMNSEIYNDETNESLDELIDSIKRNGILQKILIKDDGTIVSGHRRRRAALIAGLAEDEVGIVSPEDHDAELEILLASNIHRRKTYLEVWKEGKHMLAVMDRRGIEGRATDHVADRLGMNSGRTFERLDTVFTHGPEVIRQKLVTGDLTVSGAYDITKALQKQPEETAALAAELMNADPNLDHERAIRRAHVQLQPPKEPVIGSDLPTLPPVAMSDGEKAQRTPAAKPASNLVNFQPRTAEAEPEAEAPAAKPPAAAPTGGYGGILLYAPWDPKMIGFKPGRLLDTYKKGKASFDIMETQVEGYRLDELGADASAMGIMCYGPAVAEGIAMLNDLGYDFRTAIAVTYNKIELIKSDEIAENTAFLVLGTRGDLSKQPVGLSNNQINVHGKDPLGTVPAKALDALMALAPGKYIKVWGPALPEHAADDGWVDAELQAQAS